MPTTRSLSLPVPGLKLESVNWYGDDDTVPEVDWVLLMAIELEPPPDELCVVAFAVFDGLLVPTELMAETR